VLGRGVLERDVDCHIETEIEQEGSRISIDSVGCHSREDGPRSSLVRGVVGQKRRRVVLTRGCAVTMPTHANSQPVVIEIREIPSESQGAARKRNRSNETFERERNEGMDVLPQAPRPSFKPKAMVLYEQLFKVLPLSSKFDFRTLWQRNSRSHIMSSSCYSRDRQTWQPCSRRSTGMTFQVFTPQHNNCLARE
jgi:hypothetical protein